MQRKKGSKRIEMIIEMVNEFKLTIFHLRAQTRCKSVHARGFTARQQNCVGLRATGPPGRRAAGPPGRWAAGPWRAVGRGPLGRGPAFSKTRSRSEVDVIGNLSWLKAVVFLWRFGALFRDARAICGTRSPRVTSLSSLYEGK